MNRQEVEQFWTFWGWNWAWGGEPESGCWLSPDKKRERLLPPLDMNNLTKWCLESEKVVSFTMGKECTSDLPYFVRIWGRNGAYLADTDTPQEALLSALWQMVKAEDKR